jgi:CRP-like cAMP-binding protein
LKTVQPPPPSPEAGIPKDRLLKPEVLRRLSLLSVLANDELADLTSQMRVKRYSSGEFVIKKGTLSDSLMFVLAGRLQVVDYTEDGKEIGLNLIGQGAFFGELGLVDGLPRSADVISLSSSAIAFLSKSQALKLIYGNPQIAETMLRHFADKIRMLSLYRALLALPNAHQRVYALLCRVKKPLVVAGSESVDVIENLPTQQQMAIMVNTSRETVSRAISELIHQGVLQKNKRVVIVRQPQKLEDLAGEKSSG